MIKILVTGGSGFIGTSVIKSLLLEGYDVNCLDISKPKVDFEKKFKFFKGNIFEDKVVRKAIKGCKIVIHLAASLGVKHTDQNIVDCLDNNILGVKKILIHSIKNKVQKFIFSSSSEVYGDQRSFPIDEDAELKNKSIYATSKIVAEKYIEGFAKNKKIKYNIVRFFNVFGPGQKSNFVIPKFIERINKGKDLQIYGDGNQIRSFCNIVDATKGLIGVIKRGKPNSIYNIGNNNEPISILNLAKKISKLAEKKNIKIKKITYRNSDRTKEREILKRIPNLSKIKNDTGYEPKITLENGIKEILRENKVNKLDKLKNKIGIGTLQWGFKYGIANKKGKLSNKEIIKIKNIAEKNNINFIDTAHAYGNCEERIGNIDFKNFNLITKLPATKPGTNTQKWVDKSITNSLKKLKVESLYCMHVHNTQYLLGQNGTKIFKRLERAKKKGLIKKIGVSIYTVKELNDILKKFKIDLVLLPFNIFDQRTIKLKIFEKLKKLNIEIHARSVFLQGLLTMPLNEIPNKFHKYNKYFLNLDKTSKKIKKSKIEICLQYALSNPYVDKVILGVDSSKQFKYLISKCNFIKLNLKKFDASKEIDLINPSRW